MYAVGVDSGTQGTKVLVVGFDGRVSGRGFAPHRFIDGLGPGESEQDPQVWVKALESSLAAALQAAGIDPRSVVSLGISGQQHGFVPLDETGRPIRPAKLWNDTSTVEETDILIERLGGREACVEKLGLIPAVGFTASKVLWLKRHEADNFRRLRCILLPHNYLNFILTGRLHMEYGDASGTGLMDIRNLAWHPLALAAVDETLPGKLPPLSHPSEPVGFVDKDWAARFGLGRVLVSGGGGDNMMGAIGTGNVRPGVCTLSLGTSGTVYSHVERPFVDPAGEIAAFCGSSGGWLPLLCTMNVTNTTEHLKILLDIDNSRLEELASRAPAGAEGLLFLPFIDGERVPVLPLASGVFFGLTRRNFLAPHACRSVMEGTILNLGYGLGRMRELGLRPDEMRATGGGSRSRLWLQVAADVFRSPVVTLEEQEAAAFGAALQSMWCYRREAGEDVGIEDVCGETVHAVGRVFEPDAGRAELYSRLQERFDSLWRSLREEFGRHRDFSARF